MKTLILFSLLLAQTVDHVACGTRETVDKDTPASLSPCNGALWARTYGAMSRFGDPATINWNGDPYVRQNLKHRCVHNIKAAVKGFSPQSDGDIKLTLQLYESNFQNRIPLPEGFSPLVKSEFYPRGSTQTGTLVAEVVCAAPVTNPEPKVRAACAGYRSNILRLDTSGGKTRVLYNNGEVMKIGDVIYVTGERIHDTGLSEVPGSSPRRYKIGHDHMEIHPVSEIRK